MQKQNKKRTYPSITNAPYWSRLGAYLVDFIVLLVVGLISFIATDAIYTRTKAGQNANEAIFHLRDKSRLFLIDYGAQEANYLSYDITEGNNEFIFFYRLELFYTTPDTGFIYETSFYYEEGKSFDYLTMVLKMGDESSLFTFDEDADPVTYKLKDSLSSSEKNKAWQYLYDIALKSLHSNPDYQEAERPLKDFVAVNLTIAAFIGTIIPNLFFPLLVGHGRSLGKFMTGLAVVDKEGYEVKTKAVILRFFVYSVFETASNIYLFFVPLLLTSGVLTITHNNRAIHDLVSGTYVVSAKQSKIFKNRDDEEVYYLSTPEEKAKNMSYFTERPLPKSK